MAEQVTEGQDKKGLGRWEKPMKVLAKVATKGKEALKAGYCFAIGVGYGLSGMPVDMEQIKRDTEIELQIAKQHIEYHAMMTKLKAQARHLDSSDPEKRRQAEIAEKQLAYAKIIDILEDTGLEMLGVSASRMMIYKTDLLVKQKLDAVKKAEQKLTRAQQMDSAYNETLSEEEILKEALINAFKKREGFEGKDIAAVIDSVLRTKVQELPKIIAEKAGVSLVGEMVGDSLFGKRAFEQSEDRLKKSENYRNQLEGFVGDVEASSDTVRTVDNQIGLADLYVKCKKENNMDAFYAKVESLYKEAFALNNLEVNPHYRSKVGKKESFAERFAFVTNNLIENMKSKGVEEGPQQA